MGQHVDPYEELTGQHEDPHDSMGKQGVPTRSSRDSTRCSLSLPVAPRGLILMQSWATPGRWTRSPAMLLGRTLGARCQPS
eukprot:4835306-Pyramimonas_sp.AAC.1